MKSQGIGLIAAWFYCACGHAFPVDEMHGRWLGESTSAFYKARAQLPSYYDVTKMVVKVYSNSKVVGKLSDGCQFEGVIIKSTSSQYPIRGVVSGCKEKRMNGKFEGMFNRSGEIRIIVKEMSLGRGDFYGKLVRHPGDMGDSSGS